MSEKNVYTLARKITQALIEDGKTKGYDLEAGLFGLEFSKLVRQFAALEAENVELRKDKERLDWVTRCLWFKCVPLVFSYRSTKSRIEFNYPGEDDSNIYGKDIRSAIDLAMAKEKEGYCG